MKIAIVGSGPAALMAADVLAHAGQSVEIIEKRKSAGRKLLVAGSSGLNITNRLPLSEFIKHYSGPEDFWSTTLGAFTPQDWIRFIETELGIATFEGTSGRHFVEDMKASRLLQAWIERLRTKGVRFRYELECTGFTEENGARSLHLSTGERARYDAVCFCLGGGSWEPTEVPLRWPEMFKRQGVAFKDFTPSNVGYRVEWTEAFLKEAARMPLKGIVLRSSRGSRKGDAMITEYGIEGTPVYFAGTTGPIRIDLKPDLDVDAIVARLEQTKENLTPIRRVQKLLKLCEAANALVYHFTPADILKGPSLRPLAERIKSFPLTLLEPQPLTEAISSAGGVSLDEIDDCLMLKKHPGFFVAGEMLDWDAPTGGFLIQACVAQGHAAATGMLSWLSSGSATS